MSRPHAELELGDRKPPKLTHSLPKCQIPSIVDPTGSRDAQRAGADHSFPLVSGSKENLSSRQGSWAPSSLLSGHGRDGRKLCQRSVCSGSACSSFEVRKLPASRQGKCCRLLHLPDLQQAPAGLKFISSCTLRGGSARQSPFQPQQLLGSCLCQALEQTAASQVCPGAFLSKL